jgi:hypothetical protein
MPVKLPVRLPVLPVQSGGALADWEQGGGDSEQPARELDGYS